MSTTPESRQQSKLRAAIAVAAVAAVGLLAAAIAIVLTTAPGHGEQPAQTPRFTAASHPAFAPSTAGEATRLQVHAGDYWFALNTQQIPAGKVTFAARNVGATVHDVMIERLPIKLSAPGVPVDAAADGGIDGLEPGSSQATSVVLRPGRYAVFCSVPGHFKAGQHGELRVTEPVPGARA